MASVPQTWLIANAHIVARAFLLKEDRPQDRNHCKQRLNTLATYLGYSLALESLYSIYKGLGSISITHIHIYIHTRDIA